MGARRRGQTGTVVAVAMLLAAGPATACSTKPAAGSAQRTATTTPLPAPDPPTSLDPAHAALWHPVREPGVGGRVTTAWIDPADPRHVVAGGDMLSVAATFDGGRNWTPSSGLPGHEINRVQSPPGRASPIWVGTMSGPAVSTDGGRTFTEKRRGMPEPSPDSYTAPIDTVLFDPADANHLVALGGSHRHWPSPSPATLWGAVWDSTDGGDTWRRLDDVVKGGNVVSATWTADGSIVAAVLQHGLYRSADRGRTWTKVSTPTDDVAEVETHPQQAGSWWIATATTAPPDRSKPAARGPGTVYATTDGGATWHERSHGLTRIANPSRNEQSQYLSIAAAPSRPDVVYTSDNGWDAAKLFRSDDGGGTWRTILDQDHLPAEVYSSGLSAREFAIDPADADHVVVAADDRVLETRDGGAHWADLTESAVQGGYVGHGYSGIVAADVAFNPYRSGDVSLAGFDGANPLRTTDGGSTWQRPLGGHANWGGAYSVSYGSSDAMFVLLGQAGTFDGVARSVDGGRTWSVARDAASGLPAVTPNYHDRLSPGAVLALDASRVLVTVAGDIYRSTDGGAHFAAVDRGHGLGSLAASIGHPDHVIAAGESGLVESTDGGATWKVVPGAPGSPAEYGGIALSDDGEPRAYMAIRSVGGSNGVWRRQRGGWRRVLDLDDVHDVAIDPTDPRRLLAATSDLPGHDHMRSTGLWLSTDGGSTWTRHSDGLAMSRVPTVAFDPHRSGHAIVGTAGGGFLEAEFGPA